MSISKTLSNDLRTHIRALGNFPILSDSWCSMADTFGRIANISEMEAKLPKDREDATLWECEELALRYVLEDGKLNLCLRNLIEYKNFERDMRNNASAVPVSSEQKEKLDAFEKGLGTVLRNAWRHIEALQTTDVPLLINYIGDVFEDSIQYPEILERHAKTEDLFLRQEIIVIYYLNGLMSQIEEMSEDRVMPLIKERRIFTLLATVLQVHHLQMRMEDILQALTTLAMICDTEDFQTYKDYDYVQTLDEKETFCILNMDFIANMVEDDWDVRRKIRPLLDFIREVERELK
eukprot:CAMPEP_0117753926 /NCGR_PEP_ID=MMETSP0947-20121206/12530_1 /TAXON_ID=44440 /ORGANISM="Chattonella subsalsa, Strain CCMP2191" /LENGTH=291 /DNA_ID=CAMNT_0005572929 /DNA_START=239 /DNA_END=1114 /DNA_ORIENTATION=-